MQLYIYSGFDIHDEDLILFCSIFLALQKREIQILQEKSQHSFPPTHGFVGWIFFCPNGVRRPGEDFPPKRLEFMHPRPPQNMTVIFF